MGWFGGSAPVKVSPVTNVKENKPQQFLEDLPPKFEDKETVDYKQPTYVDAMKQVKLSDFSVERFVSMPCFRDAMLTGFQAMGVLSMVTFLIHKNPSKSMNWGVCGFFLGNVVGWEQCRSIRRKSFQTMENAKRVNIEKNAKKLEGFEEDENLKKWKEVQQHEDN